MIKVNIEGCKPFVKAEEFEQYADKALDAFDVLLK